VASEVTLSFTSPALRVCKANPETRNFVAFRQIRAGRKIEQSSGATAPHRFTDEVTLLRTIPAIPMGTTGSRLGLSYWLLTKQAAFRGRISPAFAEALCWVEVTRTFTTPDPFLWRESAA